MRCNGISGLREDFLRDLPDSGEAGSTVAVPAHRNDQEAAPHGVRHYGDSSWEDLDAVLTWAKGPVAEPFVLLGQSVERAISLQTRDRWRRQDAISAIEVTLDHHKACSGTSRSAEWGVEQQDGQILPVMPIVIDKASAFVGVQSPTGGTCPSPRPGVSEDDGSR